MGNFANTLFSVLLGWVQRVTAWLWQLITAEGQGGLMDWLLDNWLALAVGLCVLGVVVDALVYLIRWQPYRVWWGRREETPPPVAADETEALQWVYANGEIATEIPAPQATPEPAGTPQEAGRHGRVIPARRHAQAADGYVGDDQHGYHQPYYPPRWNGGKHQWSDGGTQE